jgi:hypothetical protein
MEIKDFIKEALLQIVDGVTSANDELKSKGAYIHTNNVIGEGLLATVNHERRETKNHIKVDFDLAVVLSQVDSTKLDGSLKASGEGKLKIAPFIKIGMGADTEGSASNENKNENQSIHRIKCTIPLSLPESLNK